MKNTITIEINKITVHKFMKKKKTKGNERIFLLANFDVNATIYTIIGSLVFGWVVADSCVDDASYI